jgi:predicted nucleotidyltransferase
MRFTELVEACLEEALVPAVQELLKQKMETPELGLGPRVGIINEYLERSIEEVNDAIRMLPTEETETWEELNRLFLDTVMDAAR